MPSSLRRSFSLMVALLLMVSSFAGCKKQVVSESRELPYTDITAESADWQAETCRLIIEGDTAMIQGRIRNIGAWTNAGLTMYVRFLDAEGELLVLGSCNTVFDEAIEPKGTAGYTVNIRNFYDFEKIASCTIEFGK